MRQQGAPCLIMVCSNFPFGEIHQLNTDVNTLNIFPMGNGQFFSTNARFED